MDMQRVRNIAPSTLLLGTQTASAATILKAVFRPSNIQLTPFLLDMLVVLLINQKDYEHCGNRKDWGMVFSRFVGSWARRVEKPLRQEVPWLRVILNSELLAFILSPAGLF